MSNPSYNGRTILIAWEHDAIPGLAQAFGVQVPPADQEWPDYVFDEAWVLDFGHGASASLQIIPENVLPGDNPLGGVSWTNPPGFMNQSEIPQDIVEQCVTDNPIDSLASSLAVPPLQ